MGEHRSRRRSESSSGALTTLPGFEPPTPVPKELVNVPDGATVVRVQPDITAIVGGFDYFVPPQWGDDGRAAKVALGSMVRVDFAGRRVAGWVTELGVEPTGTHVVRPLLKVSGYGPPGEVIELADWAAWRWAGKRAHLLRVASPPKMVLGVAKRSLVRSPVEHLAFGSGSTVARTVPTDDGQAMATAVAEAGGGLILTPSVEDKRRIVSALRQGGVDVASYPEEWSRSAAGVTTVGTRTAAFAPLPDMQAVLVLDAHDDRYKEERTPAWDAREVVIERARRSGVPCVFSSPVPTLHLLEATDRLLGPSRAQERAGWPNVHVVDLRVAERPGLLTNCLLYTSPSPRDRTRSRMPSSA